MVQQLCNPVHWKSIIQNIVKNQVTKIVECFPGNLLVNLNKRIDSKIISFSLKTLDDFNNTNNALNEGI